MTHTSTAFHLGPHIVVTDFRCAGACATHRGWEEAAAGHEIAITRQGTWTRHDAHGRHLADATRVFLFNGRAPYRIEHPVAGGDHCIAVQYGDCLLAHAAEGLRARLKCEATPFQVPWVVARPAIQLLAARLFARLSRIHAQDPLDRLACEELALELLTAVLEGLDPATGRQRPRQRSHARQQELVRAAEVEIARRFTEGVRLGDLARRLGCSPFHLAHTFRRHTGGAIHQRLVQLRLADALARLADSRAAIATIAHEIGFADHAHLTATFARRFRMTPSGFRRELASNTRS